VHLWLKNDSVIQKWLRLCASRTRSSLCHSRWRDARGRARQSRLAGLENFGLILAAMICADVCDGILIES